jgi:hypothetical protein
MGIIGIPPREDVFANRMSELIWFLTKKWEISSSEQHVIHFRDQDLLLSICEAEAAM